MNETIQRFTEDFGPGPRLREVVPDDQGTSAIFVKSALGEGYLNIAGERLSIKLDSLVDSGDLMVTLANGRRFLVTLEETVQSVAAGLEREIYNLARGTK